MQAMSENAEKGERGAFGALLRDGYYPGDIGFDPLGLKPTDANRKPTTIKNENKIEANRRQLKPTEANYD